jgi:cytochrome b subunit of formate dehydrogenase
MNCHVSRPLIFILSIVILLYSAPLIAEECMDCHREGAGRNAPAVKPLDDRAHREKTCVECHPGKMPPCPPRLEPVGCRDCHGKEVKAVGASSHGKKLAAHFKEKQGKVRLEDVCLSCHGEGAHYMRAKDDPLSPVYPTNVHTACLDCHFGLDSLGAEKFYPESYHGLAIRLGDMRSASCVSCHSNHSIMESPDPGAPTNPANLSGLCASCHPEAQKGPVSGPVHARRHGAGIIVKLARGFYIVAIILIVGFMAVHNLMDLAYRLRGGRPHMRSEEPGERFTMNEKLQHALLTISFLVLACTGFALSFPESFMAGPFHWLDHGALVRKWAHRASALVFIALFVYHFIWLALARRGRIQAGLLRPRSGDFGDLRRAVSNYAGKGEGPLALPHYTYVEKAEYWCLVWGGAVMCASGLVLMSADRLIARAPLWVIDLASAVHYYEAVLAVSALLVWHGYWAAAETGREKRAGG